MVSCRDDGDKYSGERREDCLHGGVLLSATGLTSPAARKAFLDVLGDGSSFSTAAIVTTASREFKERNKHAVAARDALLGFGIGRVKFVDVEFEDAALLRGCGVIYVNGGDPLYLMRHLRRSGADAVLREIVATQSALVIGTSAGAVVLGPDLRIVPAFDPELARDHEWGDDLTGVGLVPFTVLPHANRWGDKLPDLNGQLRRFAQETGLMVEPIRDGEALLVGGSGGKGVPIQRYGL
jgi:dipeptidase E